MKKIWTGVKIALCVSAAFGWWGVLYPELVLTADTCRVYSVQDEQECPAEEDIYWSLLKADRREICFRSKFLIEWNKFMEALNESDQNGAAP